MIFIGEKGLFYVMEKSKKGYENAKKGDFLNVLTHKKTPFWHFSHLVLFYQQKIIFWQKFIPIFSKTIGAEKVYFFQLF